MNRRQLGIPEHRAVVVMCLLALHGACSADGANRSERRATLVRQSGEIFREILSSVDANETSRDALRQVAVGFETLAADENDPQLQLLDLRRAAMTYLRSAAPNSMTPSDALLRRHPAMGWNDYVRVSIDLLRRFDSLNDPEAIAIVIPDGLFFGSTEGPGFVYGSEYWQPGLALYREAANNTVRILAASNVVTRCFLADWRLACEISSEAYGLEEQAAPSTLAEVRRLYEAVDSMHRVMSDELIRMGKDLNGALASRVKDGSGKIDAGDLQDSERIWEILAPHLPDAIDTDGKSPRRISSWMDFQTNRLSSVPGLRIAGVRGLDADKDGEGVVLDFVQVFWVETSPGAVTPWARRMYERAKRIDPATVRGNPWFEGQESEK